jgi:hypothetical protein
MSQGETAAVLRSHRRGCVLLRDEAVRVRHGDDERGVASGKPLYPKLASGGPESPAMRRYWVAVPIYRLPDTAGDDLSLVEHSAPNLEPGDVVVVAHGREAVVMARVEAEPGPGPLVAMLEVAIAPSRPLP